MASNHTVVVVFLVFVKHKTFVRIMHSETYDVEIYTLI